MFKRTLATYYLFLILASCQGMPELLAYGLEGISLISSICTISTTLKSFFEIHARDSGEIRSLHESIDRIGTDLKEMKIHQSYETHILNRIYEIKIKSKSIDDLYKNLFDMTEKNHSHITKTRFADDLLRLYGVPGIIGNIQGSLAGIGADFNLVNLIYEHFEYMFRCSSVSKQRYLYNLLRSYLDTEIKGYILMRFAYFIRTINEQDSLIPEITTLNNNFCDRIQETVKVFKILLNSSSRIVRRCDLRENHSKDVTYTILENAFSRIIYSANDIKSYFWKTKCPDEDENSSIGVRPECYDKKECSIKQRECNHLVHCKRADPYTICLQKDQSQNRRYQFIEKHLLFLKRDEKPQVCNGTSISYVHGSHTRIYVDHSCLCVCDDPDSISDRYFYLGNVVSDIKSNYVVTGVRFVKLQNTIFIEIQQGELLPYSIVNTNTLEWSLRDYEKPIQDIYSKSSRHKLRWHDKRGIFLDLIDVPSNQYVITGVRFNTEIFNYELVIKLEIQVTEYNENSGRLLLETSYWQSTYHTEDDTDLYEVYKYDAPINVKNENKVNYTQKSYIRFAPTDIESKDAGSTVVPYFDMQNVEAAAPLSTIGLEFMGNQDSGGFISLMAKTYDIMSQL